MVLSRSRWSLHLAGAVEVGLEDLAVHHVVILVHERRARHLRVVDAFVLGSVETQCLRDAQREILEK